MSCFRHSDKSSHGFPKIIHHISVAPKLSKKAFLKKLTFDLAKPDIEIRPSLFNQKHSVRSGGVLVGFPAPSFLAEPPNTVNASRIMRCMNLHAHDAMTVVEGYAQNIGSCSKPASVDILSQL